MVPALMFVAEVVVVFPAWWVVGVVVGVVAGVVVVVAVVVAVVAEGVVSAHCVL